MDDIAGDESEPPLSRFAPPNAHLSDAGASQPRPSSHPNHTTSRPLSLRSHDAAHERPFGSGEPKAQNHVADSSSPSLPPPAPPPPHAQDADEKDAPVKPAGKPSLLKRVGPGLRRFALHSKDAIFHSWINVLLVFVPVGIAMEYAPLPEDIKPTIVFSTNAIAIVPLAGLLAYATESVASRMGDTLASLLNVTFGNAVELIIFVIALAKDQIRITQASILGSILANLLLILGMSFLFGGLRFQEQIYNSTVTQMSAVLLSLSVMSLLLPTAFHASFLDNSQADVATTKISRGVSVVLLIVYILYLLFQLKSHAYMYESTPQQKIDEESHPGVLADILNSSSSDSDSSSSDSDSSLGSHVTTRKRIKRAVKKRMRRKSSGTESISNLTANSTLTSPTSALSSAHGEKPSIFNEPVAETNAEYFDQSLEEHHAHGGVLSDDHPDPRIRDFENASAESSKSPPTRVSKHTFSRKNRKSRRGRSKTTAKAAGNLSIQPVESTPSDQAHQTVTAPQSQPHVLFSDDVQGPILEEGADTSKTGFTRSISRTAFRGPAHLPLPRLLSNTVFTQPAPPRQSKAAPQNSLSLAHRPGPRRTTSLPDRLRRPDAGARAGSTKNVSGAVPSLQPLGGLPGNAAEAQLRDSEGDGKRNEMSRTAAVVLLLVTTGLVAFCAELLVRAIPEMVQNTSVSEAFIGLIILPIVGNAAEHVTAVTVAAKNKMDLAIGVAVGSSIQIALFITPLVVLLGWFMSKAMSLYFNLFETVSLFVTVFVTNFLILDGRSNYLEGSLLIAAYVIIALSAFFYPQDSEQSELGGSTNSTLSVVQYVAGPHMNPGFRF